MQKSKLNINIHQIPIRNKIKLLNIGKLISFLWRFCRFLHSIYESHVGFHDRYRTWNHLPERNHINKINFRCLVFR